MTESNAIITYDQPLEHLLQAFEYYLMRDDNDSRPINLTDIPSSSQQNPFPVNPPMLDQSTVADASGVLLDAPFIFDDGDMFDEEFQTNPSRVQDEINIGDNTVNRSSDFGNPIQLSTWPLQVSPYTCSCCQILREISHTNGVDISKLEIHGRLGVICHAILEKYSFDLTTNQSHEYKMFDFCKESISRVKQFLVEYCNGQKMNGYILLQDPLSSFYEAICVGLDWEVSMITGDHVNDDPGDGQMNQLPDAECSRARLNKTTLSIQRERTGKLTIRDLVGYFHIPIEGAAKNIQVCPTVIKKICRKHGLSRWPYRKINSIEKKISKKEKYLTSVDAEHRSRAQAEINTLRQEIANIYSSFNV